MFQMAPNGCKRIKMAINGSNGSKSVKPIKILKRSQTVQYFLLKWQIWLKQAKKCQKVQTKIC